MYELILWIKDREGESATSRGWYKTEAEAAAAWDRDCYNPSNVAGMLVNYHWSEIRQCLADVETGGAGWK